MKRMKYLAVAVAAVLLQVLAAQAAKYTWVGPLSGGSWTDSANWSPNTGYPGYNNGYDDRAVFAPGDGVTLTVNGTTNGRYFDVSNGHVVVVSPGGNKYHNMYRTGSVFVNAGAEFNLTGERFKSNNNNTQTLTKSGGGLFSVVTFGSSATSGPFAQVNVNAGTLRISGNAYGSNFTVKDGGTLEIADSSTFNGAGDPLVRAQIEVQKGGVLKWLTSKTSTIAGVTGAGTIQGGGTGRLNFDLSRGPLEFSGTTLDFPRLVFANTASVAADDFIYTVSNPRALENARVADTGAIRFASGITDAYIGKVVGDDSATDLVMKNADGDPITMHALVDVGQYAGGVRLTDGVWCGGITNSAANGQLTVSGSNTLDDISMTLDRTIAFEEGATLVQDGGIVCAGVESNKPNVVTREFLPTGVMFDDLTMSGTFRVTGGGEAWVNGSAGGLPKRLVVLDSTLTMIRGDWYGAYATEQEPCEVVLDNATLRLSGRNGAVSGNALTMNVFKDGANAKLEIGSRGGTFASVDSRYNGEGQDNVGYTKSYVQFHHPFLGVGGNPRGPLTFLGWTNWRYWKAFGSGGTVSFLDGIHTAMDASEIEAADGAFFGDGDIRIRGAMVGFEPGVASSVPLRLAMGAGHKLIYEDNAGIQLSPDSGGVAKNLELGTLERVGAGSALFICNGDSTIGKNGGSTVKLAAAPAVNADGIVLDPIYQSHDSNAAVLPFKYDETKGLVSMTVSDFVEGLNEGKYSKVTSPLYSTGGTPSVAGLYVTAKIGLGSSEALTVGDGVHPAYVAFNTVATAFDNGTLAFGGSEGVLISPGSYQNAGNNVGCRITGSNGLSILGPPEDLRGSYINLNAANAYTGGTRVSGAIVGANHVNCFANGPVHVNGGDYAGGAVWFKVAGTWTNAFTVRGFGRRKEKYNADPFGALVFWDAVTLAGDVELAGPTKMSVWTDVDSTISGTVSGDRLSLYSFKANKGGVLELAGHNTYTGGTEVVQQSVAICEQDGFGTGPVRVEKGVVVFRNPSAITVPNTMSGHDVTLRYDGAGAVTLANAADLGVTRVEVTPGEHAFASDFTMRPLVSTAEKPRKAAVLVLKAGATYTLSQDDLQGYFDIVLKDGAMLDLGGEELTVCRFTGNRANVNGTIVETNPKGGVLLIVR